jgi:hypothetical protein
MKIVDQINKDLAAVFSKNDPVYRSLIADYTGVPAPVISTPMDLNMGALASVVEWNRRLTKSLIKMLFFDTAQGVFLSMIVSDHLGIVRGSGESDADYQRRVTEIILGHKVSPTAIINALVPYSFPNRPLLYEGQEGSAYADQSFSDVYTEFQVVSPVMRDEWVFPAVTMALAGSIYSITVLLENTPNTSIPLVLDLLDRLVVAGVDYTLIVTQDEITP